MLTWPRRDGDFAKVFDAVERNFIDIAVAIARFESLHVNVADDSARLTRRLVEAGVPAARLRVYEVPNDDVWARDHGPITVIRDGRLVHLDFRFNGWGGKFPAERDDALTRRLAGLGAWSAPVESIDFVLEGGGIESDGAGSLLTTERCLLAPTRNPRLDRAGIEAVLKKTLGIERILWLRHGDLLGDDTDGHIDTIARFCDERTIAYQSCDDRTDPHHAELAAMAAELAALRTRDGAPYRLVPLPLPRAIHDPDDGRRLPAGYANFLIVNGAVLVPTYADPGDSVALQRLAPYFPSREIVGIDCRALIHQYGSLHCVTMQIPQSVPSP
jgi:agmatine/peptidylarginine deiminase